MACQFAFFFVSSFYKQGYLVVLKRGWGIAMTIADRILKPPMMVSPWNPADDSSNVLAFDKTGD